MITILMAVATACVRVPNPPSIAAGGGPAYMEACNVTPPGWRPMSEAPRDGTVIEIRNAFGVLPTYSINRWSGSDDQMWSDAKPRPPCHDPAPTTVKDKQGKVIGYYSTGSCFISLGFEARSEPGLAWRPFVGNPAAYREHNPTMAQWRAAPPR